MKTLYHGTTLENWESIKANGWGGEVPVWTCSNLSEIYFYDLDKGFDCIDDLEEREQGHIRRAFESGQIAAALYGCKSEKLVVIRVEIEEHLVEDDLSCENMADTASTVEIEDLDQYGKITAIYQSDDYSEALRFFYISGLYGRDYFDVSHLSEKEIRALEIIQKSGVFIDELLEIEWETVEEFKAQIAA